MEINGLTLNLNVFEANQAQKLIDSYESVANEAERAQGKRFTRTDYNPVQKLLMQAFVYIFMERCWNSCVRI